MRVCTVAPTMTRWKWHEKARRLAVAIGDEATIAAIIYNKATMNCLRVQTNIALGRYEDASAKFLDLQVDSADYFHRAAHHTSLRQLTQALRARQKMASGDFAEAARLFSDVIATELPTSYVDDVGLLRSELALCLSKVGETSRATDIARELASASWPNLSPDAALVFWSCLRDVAATSGDDSLEMKVAVPQQEANELFQREVALIQAALTEVKSTLSL